MKWKIRKTNRHIITYSIIVCAVIGLFIGYGIVQSKPEVIASVNGQNINKDQLYDALVQSSGKQVLDSLISQKIVELESKKQNVVVSDADIQKEINKYYEQYGGEAGFIQALAMSGYTLDQVKKDIVDNLKVKKILEPQITITEEELKAYFEENKATFAQEKQVKASHILADSFEIANQVKQKIVNGGDFAQLAKEYSTDNGTKENGGDLGYFGSGKMAVEFEEAAFALKVGEISDPIKTEYGYHIIKLVDKKDAQEANYEQSKAEIRDALLDKKIGEEYDSWIQDLYQQYDVKNYLGQ
ncbi:MAG: foldase [Firmicutes bacterium HGW-Firmicutes-15]|nr:MAG: foldase [Firmicutes bacterium HGW-Firmicutes-15]